MHLIIVIYILHYSILDISFSLKFIQPFYAKLVDVLSDINCNCHSWLTVQIDVTKPT